MVAGRVDVDDEIEVVDVDAAGGDVGGHQDGDMAGLELGQGAGALGLGLATVQGRGADTAVQQMLGEVVHGVLGVQEHDRPTFAGGDLGGGGVLVGAVDVQHVVLHRRDRARRRIDGVDHRVRQVAPDQEVDVAVQSGREEHPLPLGPNLVEQRGDLGHEAHVGHLVGLVQHSDADLVQPAVAALDEVLEPSRRGDDHLDPAAQCAGLAADRHSADDGGQPQLERPGVGGEGVGDLLGQFPGRDQDQCQRLAGLGALPGGTGQQGQTEGQRLARSGATAAENIAPGQRVRQRGGLDGERGGHAFRAEGRQQRRRHVQLGESLGRGQGGSVGDGQGELSLECRGTPPGAPGTTRARAVRPTGTVATAA